jgi:hypothetical protein
MAKTIVEELIGLVGLEIDSASFKKGEAQFDKVKKQFDLVSRSAQRLTVAAAAVAGLTVLTNKLTAEQQRMADSVGISSDALEAYGTIAKSAGLNVDNVVDLVEELNNKFGESKGLEEMTTPVMESMKILGLEFENLKRLKPEDQFFQILDAATKLGDAQAGSSAADILLGGEASKFIGLLRTQDKTLAELIATQKSYNLLTQQGRDDALAFNNAFQGLTVIVGSATKQLAALLGKGMLPVIKAVNEWVAKNKELSQTIIKVFSIVIPAALAVAGVAVLALTAKLIVMGLALIGLTLPVVGLIAAIAFGATVFGLIVEDIYKFISSGGEANTVIGTLIDTFLEFTGLGNVFSFIGDGIDYAIQGMKQLAGLVSGFSFGSIGEGIGDFFSGFGAPSALAGIPLGAGGGTGNGGNTTVNNTNNSSAGVTVNAPNLDRNEMGRIVDQENARAVNDNSTGFER